jgi:hypothetical protein
MAVTLLSLSNGHLSLEFEPSDMTVVASAIRRRFGEPVRKAHVISAEYRFGGASFVFQNEWDDPCLISGSDEGDAILKQLHDALTGDRV